VVLGEPGIGKSSLLRAAAGSARAASLLVLLTTGIEAEAQLPFGGLHQLLRPVLGVAGALPAMQRRALAAAFGTEDGRQPEPFLIALAALNLLAEAAAEQPLLLVADDVQWLDQPSQDVLTFIARRVSADPIVMIGSVRKGYDIAFALAGLGPVSRLDGAWGELLADVAFALPDPTLLPMPVLKVRDVDEGNGDGDGVLPPLAQHLALLHVAAQVGFDFPPDDLFEAPVVLMNLQ